MCIRDSRDTVNGQLALGDIVHPVDAAQNRRLACARKADDGDKLTLLNLQVDVFQGREAVWIDVYKRQGLLQTVEGAVVREDDGSALGNFEILRRNGHARVLQRLNFTAQALQIDHDAVAQHVYNARQADAGGDEMKGEFAVRIHDGVAVSYTHLVLISAPPTAAWL